LEHAHQYQRAAAPECGQPEEEGELLVEVLDELADAQDEEATTDGCSEGSRGSR
jgi:hypothetical protein